MMEWARGYNKLLRRSSLYNPLELDAISFLKDIIRRSELKVYNALPRVSGRALDAIPWRASPAYTEMGQTMELDVVSF